MPGPPPIFKNRPVAPAASRESGGLTPDAIYRLSAQVRGANYRHPQQQSGRMLLRGTPMNGQQVALWEPGVHIERVTRSLAQPYTAWDGTYAGTCEIQRDVQGSGPLIVITGDYVTIRNFWFTDASTETTIRVDGGANVRIEQCVFDCGGVAIEASDGVNDLTVSECVFLSGTKQVWLRGTGVRHRVVGCRFDSSPALPDASIYADDAIADSLYDENIAAGAASSLLSVKALTGYSIGTAIGTVTVRP